MLGHARLADDAGLDVVSVSDHPYFAERLDAYAALAFVLGATSNITGAVIMTNLLSRPAPILARTVTGLSTISGGRVVLGIGAGGREEEIVALGVPRLSPAARVRALEEAIIVVRALSGGGDPVTFDGEFYQGHRADAGGRSRRHRSGSDALGPKTLAVTGRHADGWIPDTSPTGAARWSPSHGPSSTKRALGRERPCRRRHHLQRVRAHHPGPATSDPQRRGPLDRRRRDAMGRGTDVRRARTRRRRFHLPGPSWRRASATRH